MKKVVIALSLGLIFFAGVSKAQEIISGKNEIRIGYSDAFPLSVADAVSDGILDAILTSGKGNKKHNSTGMFEVGYRYLATNRIKVGVDFGLQKVTTESGVKPNTIAKRSNHFLVLPVAEFSYIKTNFINFYGLVGAGAILGFTKSTIGEKTDKIRAVGFAFQVNPVGIRVGKKLGGFAEGGLGIKGFVTVGLNYNF